MNSITLQCGWYSQFGQDTVFGGVGFCDVSLQHFACVGFGTIKHLDVFVTFRAIHIQVSTAVIGVAGEAIGLRHDQTLGGLIHVGASQLTTVTCKNLQLLTGICFTHQNTDIGQPIGYGGHCLNRLRDGGLDRDGRSRAGVVDQGLCNVGWTVGG